MLARSGESGVSLLFFDKGVSSVACNMIQCHLAAKATVAQRSIHSNGKTRQYESKDILSTIFYTHFDNEYSQHWDVFFRLNDYLNSMKWFHTRPLIILHAITTRWYHQF